MTRLFPFVQSCLQSGRLLFFEQDYSDENKNIPAFPENERTVGSIVYYTNILDLSLNWVFGCRMDCLLC